MIGVLMIVMLMSNEDDEDLDDDKVDGGRVRREY